MNEFTWPSLLDPALLRPCPGCQRSDLLSSVHEARLQLNPEKTHLRNRCHGARRRGRGRPELLPLAGSRMDCTFSLGRGTGPDSGCGDQRYASLILMTMETDY